MPNYLCRAAEVKSNPVLPEGVFILEYNSALSCLKTKREGERGEEGRERKRERERVREGQDISLSIHNHTV